MKFKEFVNEKALIKEDAEKVVTSEYLRSYIKEHGREHLEMYVASVQAQNASTKEQDMYDYFHGGVLGSTQMKNDELISTAAFFAANMEIADFLEIVNS